MDPTERKALQRFVLNENIRRFQSRLDETTDTRARAWLVEMIRAAQRELAVLDAAARGAQRPWENIPPDRLAGERARARDRFRAEYADRPGPAALLDPAPGLAVVDVNRAFERAADMSRDQIVGQPMFLLFPDNPNDPEATGVSNLYNSLRTAAQTLQPHEMALQRYDTKDASGVWSARYWRPLNTPLLDEDGRLVLLLHAVEEATADVLGC